MQAALGIDHGVAFDLQAVCSGFVFAVATADKFLVSGSHKRALVIGAETFSRLLDWTDRTTCVLFGDGAGAIVLEAAASDGKLTSPGVISTQLRSDGRHRAKLYVDGGPSTTKTVGHLRMEGREVFKHAVGMVTDVIKACFDDAGVTAADIDWFVPHQANRRIIDASADKLGLAREKVVVTVDRHGNTSAASIPLALDVAVKDGRIKKGDLVMIEAMGGGFTWGAALIRVVRRASCDVEPRRRDRRLVRGGDRGRRRAVGRGGPDPAVERPARRHSPGARRTELRPCSPAALDGAPRRDRDGRLGRPSRLALLSRRRARPRGGAATARGWCGPPRTGSPAATRRSST